MLQLRDISKSYTTGDFTQTALDKVSLNFRQSEFVAILGPSGSGKTTCLNIVGGLDQYDSGDLVINDRSTKNFSDSDWDAYRNNSVGFIFQSYNLITHLSIIDNVELGMTLSGVSSEEKHRNALEVLEKVGLKDHVHKKPNQLSGGQMQRVAIARALANDPDIILADEPTGALDSQTSEQIMELIKEIADDKLVIMVTHNPELAEEYADRIVNFQDGKITDDSNPYEQLSSSSNYSLKKTSMSFLTALKLSGRNISTKKWRTLLTAFASSIGIIGIALILSLSSGFQVQIDKFQQDALSEFPIIVSQTAMSTDRESMAQMRGGFTGKKEFADSDEVYPFDPLESEMIHENIITDEYVEYIEDIDPDILNSIGYTRLTGMNLVRKIGDEVFPVSISFEINAGGNNPSQPPIASSSRGSVTGLSSYPKAMTEGDESYLEKNYDVLAGSYPSADTDLVLVVDNQNRVDKSSLENLGFDIETDSIDFDELVGTEFKLVTNDDYYEKTPLGNFIPGSDYSDMYDSENSIELEISGIVRLKEDVSIGILGNGLAYSDELVQRVLDSSTNSEIVKAQLQSDKNVITLQDIDDKTKQSLLSYLGGVSTPFMIYLYPESFDSKDSVISYLDSYNEGVPEDDMIIYSDLASSITEMTGGIMNAITLVLIAFASISLVVSLIMIGIITYISVLERTKEIGVLRALGARKKDITRVFNAETFIIGAFSGLLGITIAYIFTFPINIVIENMTELQNVARLNPLHALALVTISVVLTLIGGAVPAKMAAKKDPVEALRSE